MRKIRVLMVAGSMHVGGIENQLMHLVRKADRGSFQIDFTSTMPQAAYREEIERLGSRFYLIPDMNWRNPIPYCVRMYKIMKYGKYDVVHSHELFHSGITLLIAKIAGVSCRFAHAHNWSDEDGTGRRRGLVRSVYNIVMRRLINSLATTKIACSSWAGEFVYGKKGTRTKAYHVVFNSVDTTRFLGNYGTAPCIDYPETDGWKNVLNVARVTAVKNQIFLAEIAGELKNRGRKIRILCAGAGDEDVVKAVNQYIDKYQLHDYIVMLGVRNDIDLLMRQCSAFVLPSKYEGMPLVMIEAQASGLQCVSADSYSPEVDFEIGTVTWLSLSDGVSTWTDAIEQAVTLGRAPKQAVEQAIREKRFDSKMFAATLCGLYERDYAMHKRKKQ